MSHLFSMIYQPHPEETLTQEEQQIYRRIIDRHRKYISEKYNLSKRPNNHIFEFKHRSKSRFYQECRETQFINTLLNRPATEGSKLSLAELAQIPAEEFLGLCQKLQKMTIKNRKESRTPLKSINRSANKRYKSISQRMLPVKAQNDAESLQKNMKKVLPKLPKIGLISNRQFFELFQKKSKQAEKIKFIKEQIELQIEYKNYEKIEAIMNARKSAKDTIICLQLLRHFKNKIQETAQLSQKINKIIKQKLPELQREKEKLALQIPQQQKSQLFSISKIKVERCGKRIQAFKSIQAQVDQFRQRILDYYESQFITPLPIRELHPLIDYFHVCVKSLSISINTSLHTFGEEFFLSEEEIQDKKENKFPPEVSTITNAYTLTNFRSIYQDFTTYVKFLSLIFEHLQKVLNIKDLITTTERKRNGSTTMVKNVRMTNLRIS